MSHEHIIVSGLYYYASSPDIKDQGLAFRAETGLSEDGGPSNQKTWAGSVNLGKVSCNIMLRWEERSHSFGFILDSNTCGTCYCVFKRVSTLRYWACKLLQGDSHPKNTLLLCGGSQSTNHFESGSASSTVAPNETAIAVPIGDGDEGQDESGRSLRSFWENSWLLQVGFNSERSRAASTRADERTEVLQRSVEPSLGENIFSLWTLNIDVEGI